MAYRGKSLRRSNNIGNPTMGSHNLLEARVENDFVLALVVFSLQYVFVNHEYWKYKVKQDRWKVTLQVLGVLKTCITSIPYLTKFGLTIRDLILSDSSIHSMFFRLVCTTSPALEKLYVSRLYDWKEIDGLQQAICSMLDILVSIFSNFPEDEFPSLPMFYQAVLSTSTKPVPVAVALASLVSYFRNPAIQVGATAALSMLCSTADRFGNANFGLDKIGSFDSRNMGSSNEQTVDSTVQALKSENTTHLVDMLVLYVERSDTLVERNDKVFLSILHLMKALWQGAAHYNNILVTIRKSKKFWKQLSESILLASNKETPSAKNLSEGDAQKFSCFYQCQSAALDIMALEIFLQKKVLHADSLVKQADESSKGRVADGVETSTQASANLRRLEDILLSWSESSALSNLLRSSAACIQDADIYLHAKIAFGLLAAHIIGKLATGDAGSLSLSFSEKISAISEKLITVPAFSELCIQYSQHGYSEGTQIRTLILSDLYYHMQGELEGRCIENGPFKELSQFLMDSKLLQIYRKRFDCELLGAAKIGHLFDFMHLRHDIGLDIWDYSEWKTSKQIAETTLFHLQATNSMVLLVGSRLLALRAIMTVLTLNMGDGRQRNALNRITRDGILSCIDFVCKEFHATVGVVAAAADSPQEVLDFVAAQAELLLCLARHVDDDMPPPTCLIILKTCGFGLKALGESTLPVAEVKVTMGFLLMLLLLVLKSCSVSSPTSSPTDGESDPSGKVSNVCLGLLPVLCRCTETPDQCIISLSTMDVIFKRLLTPSTWLAIIQQHLQLQQLISMLHDEGNFESLPIILKFFLTLASVRGGAEMLIASGFLSSLRVLFSGISDGSMASLIKQEEKFTMRGCKIEKPQFIWGLGLAVLTAIMCSLGESSLCADVIENMISFFFSEKTDVIAYHLSAPDIPSDDHDKKRARALKRHASLSALRETEHTLLLVSFLAKHRSSWIKVTKETGSELRKRIIHLLAFISRTSHRLGQSSTRPPSFLCVPAFKEETDYCRKASFMNSRSGWFGVAAHECIQTPNASDESLKTAVVVKGKAKGNGDSWNPSYFSDAIAAEVYRIALLILKFLCLEAADAARRAEELGFIDLSYFPELPDPDILHGLQEQSFSIVTEVCEANRSKQMQSETQDSCCLLLRILEMALYLEFCVSQICGIRPVLGHVEDFSKALRTLVRATEGQAFMKSSMKQLMQIVSLMYPGMLQSEGIIG
ncbi:hypothetical protein Cgig2_001880 [Carnegiea gigantea]|uniref:Uncharacterized protein n=1 Tax=Carnegiea gigantea TaxID=171969 RepID=A0A9Q1QA59_9CARY|nr:hypothetical protein Cgig2_001880 [Carnegiea gigantea]